MPRTVMDEAEITRALRRIAHEIAERNGGTKQVALVGIRRGGVPLANRLAAMLRDMEPHGVPVGTLDITLYRDDAATALPNPRIGRSEIDFSPEDKVVILVDDVLYTGRTVRAAIDALLDWGRPRAIQLAALVDRGGRELPIQADYLGRVERVREGERIDVRIEEGDGSADRVEIAP